MRAEAHLIYEAGCSSPLAAKFAWKSGGEVRTASHVYETAPAHADRMAGGVFGLRMVQGRPAE